MKKILNLSFVIVFFMLGVFLLPSRKADAAVTVSVTAGGQTSLSVAYSTTQSVTIEWSSTGATSCTNNFNSSTLTSGTYSYIPTASKTFNVKCTDGKVYYQLAPCSSFHVAAEHYASNGSWSTGTLVQGATGVYYRIAESNQNDDPNKWDIGIISEPNPALCK